MGPVIDIHGGGRCVPSALKTPLQVLLPALTLLVDVDIRAYCMPVHRSALFEGQERALLI